MNRSIDSLPPDQLAIVHEMQQPTTTAKLESLYSRLTELGYTGEWGMLPDGRGRWTGEPDWEEEHWSPASAPPPGRVIEPLPAPGPEPPICRRRFMG